MSLTSLFRSLKFRSPRAPRAHGPRSPRKTPGSRHLCLESLENRSLLTSPATFGGLPYIVGPTVQPTTTSPEAEEVIAINPNNSKTLVAAIIDASQATGQAVPIVEKFAFSFDNGSTWTERFNTNVTSDGQVWQKEFDPSLAVDRLGNAYLMSVYSNTSNNANGIYVNVAHFNSNELNFSAAQSYPVATHLDLNNGSQVDQPWMTVDNSNSPYSGSVYALWQEHSANIDKATTMVFSRSTDQGKTWSTPLPISRPGQGNNLLDAQLAVGPDGEVYAVYQRWTDKNTHAQFFLAKSTDGGRTFTAPIAITPVFNDLTFASTYGKGTYPSIAVSPIDGNLFVVYADQPDGTSSQIEFMRSTDGGATFSAPVVINDTFTGQHFFSTLAVDERGVLHASWFDGRNSPTDTSKYDVYATYSLDDGATFSPNARVTPALLDAGGAQIIGDYTGIAAAGGFAHPVWVNGGVHYPPITGNGILQTATLKLPKVGGGANLLTTATTSGHPANQTLDNGQLRPLLTEAIGRWQGAGVATSGLAGIDVRIADLGGNTLGLASGHTIWLDDNAAGWGWFVDKTPRNDSEFRRPGNQGEQHRMDLLTVLEHEIGHVLGFEHADSGVMRETLTAGTRLEFDGLMLSGIDWSSVTTKNHAIVVD
jgi:Matrixin